MIDKRAPPLNRLLKVRLLPASTEEVYFVPPGGHIDKPGAIRTKALPTATTIGQKA